MLGGDYAGHSSGDHVSRASWLAERWPEVNFDAFFKVATQKHCPLVRSKRESKPLRLLCSKSGQLINMHDDFDDLPNMYDEIGLTPEMFLTNDQDELVVSLIDDYASRLYNEKSSNVFYL
jgi:hypothetical protein